MSPSLAPILIAAAAFNLLTFAVYGWDKAAARAGRARIRERSLLLLALAGGSIGALIGCRIFRHKTHKQPFRARLLGIVALQIVIAGLWLTSQWWRPLIRG
jgi:uncharacterized membrane protein YsdA (DUF1294 family)